MRLRIERDALTRGLAMVGSSVPSRPPAPALGGVLLEAAADGLFLSGYDYEVSSRATLNSVSTGDVGSVLVSGRLLAEIAKVLPGGPVDLIRDGARLRISGGQTRFALPLMPVEDYPALPALPAPTGTADRAEFADAVARVAVAAGRDDTLPMLTGINVEFHPGFLRLVSTDRFRIAIRELPWTPTEPVVSTAAMLVPARSLAAAAKAIAGDHIEIACDPGQSILGVRSGGSHHTMRLLDTPYAPYQRYLTETATATATINTPALIEAIKRVSLMASRGAQIRMTFFPSAVLLDAGDDTAGAAEETIPCEFDGDPVAIAFNPRYLLDGLNTLHAPLVEIAMNGPIRAAALRDPAARELELRQWYILMPVRPPA